MLWIGITGPMGGGKSTVASILHARGYPVIDADRVVHVLLRPGGSIERKILDRFGTNVQGADGHLDRRALGRVVFESPRALAELEAILHPQVRSAVAELRQRWAANGVKVAFYDVPLLFEKRMEEQFDAIWVVTADEPTRIRRLLGRTGLTEPEIRRRLERQLPAAYKEERATVLIRNQGGKAQLAREVDRVLRREAIPSPPVAEA